MTRKKKAWLCHLGKMTAQIGMFLVIEGSRIYGKRGKPKEEEGQEAEITAGGFTRKRSV